MNKFALTLGILLLAGLSFAQPSPPDNWMKHAVNMYGCNFEYNYKGFGSSMGLWSIVNDYGSCDYWDCTPMENDYNNMGYAIWDEGNTSGMCYYSGCWADGNGTSLTDFRSSVLAYNLNAANYKFYFLSGLRAYLAENPGGKSDILRDLQNATAGYRDCIEEETRPCNMCMA